MRAWKSLQLESNLASFGECIGRIFLAIFFGYDAEWGFRGMLFRVCTSPEISEIKSRAHSLQRAGLPKPIIGKRFDREHNSTGKKPGALFFV